MRRLVKMFFNLLGAAFSMRRRDGLLRKERFYLIVHLF